jgi:hypothetical protein
MAGFNLDSIVPGTSVEGAAKDAAPSPASGGDIIKDFLQNRDALDVLAVAEDRGNRLATEGFGSDLMDLSYGELVQKYDEDVANNRFRIQDSISNVNRIRQQQRSSGQVAGDTAGTTAAGLTGLVGSSSSLLLGAGGAVDEFFDEENTGLRDASIAVSQGTAEAVEGIKSFASTELQERRGLQAIESALDAMDSQEEFQEDLQTGMDPFEAAVRAIGRDAVNAGGRILNDAAITGDVIAEGVGSLIPSAKIASGVSKLATAATAKVTANKTAHTVAQTLGTAAGVGVTEASGTYSQTINEVMAMSHDKLMSGSAQYRAMIEEGVSPEEAQRSFASATAEMAFIRQLPISSSLGLVGGKFERSPLGAGPGSVISQGVEEALQGGTSGLTQNIAIRDNVDDERLIHEGVGEELATGAIGGVGMAGVTTSPKAAASVAGAVTKQAVEAAKSPLVREGAATTAKATGQAISTGAKAVEAVVEKAAPVVTPVVQRTRQAAEIVADKAQPVVEAAAPITNAVSDLATQGKEKRKGLVIQASRLAATTKKALESEEANTASFQQMASQADGISVPKVFGEFSRETASPISNAIGVARTLSEGKVRVNKLTPAETLYAENQFQTLSNAAPTMPKQVQREIASLVQSPDVQKVMKAARKVDLNELQTVETEVNENSVSAAVQVAKTNPTNVNPEFVGKILEQAPSDLSAEDVRILGQAQKIALAIGTHVEEQVEISSRERIALSKKPAYQANPSKLPAALTIDETSRSIAISGFRDAVGKNLRSVNDFAADIFTAAQSPDGTFVGADGVAIPAQSLAKQFVNFAIHMNNKVGALKASKEQNRNGKGPSIPFVSLAGGVKFIQPGATGNAAPMAYHSGSPKSVAFAETVANDARMTTEVLSLVQESFPELFEGMTIPEIVTLTTDDTTIVEDASDAPATEVAEQEEASDAKDSDTHGADDDTGDGTGDRDDSVAGSKEAETQERIETDQGVSGPTEAFSETYILTTQDVTNMSQFMDVVAENGNVSQAYTNFAQKLLKPVITRMNRRLTQVTISSKDKRTVTEALADGDNLTALMKFRNTAMVNEDGQYDQDMVEMVGLAVVDWLTTVTATDPSRIDETLETLGLSENDVNQENLEDILYGVPPAQAMEQIARSAMDFIGARVNVDAPLEQSRGIIEGVVKEMVSTIADNTDLIEVVTLKTKDAEGNPTTTNTINVKGLEKIQQQIKDSSTKDTITTARELLTGDRGEKPSVGEKIHTVSHTQNRSDVALSKLERTALKKMQDTPHYADHGRIALVEAMGGEALEDMLGYQEVSEGTNQSLLISVEGKNRSIQKDIRDAQDVINLIEEDTPVYYPVGITRVGRHQFKGVNPQSNKVLRALVTPTWSTVSMNDLDGFWLGVAQASDMFKVEKKNHSDILASVQDQFFGKYRGAVDMVKEWLRGGEMDGAALVEETGQIEMQQLAAIHAVAEMEFAKENGKEEFRTSLSFELDGLTNGAANMMVNFGQGEITQADFDNFNRIGFFLGSSFGSVNEFFSSGNTDLYETVSRAGERLMAKLAREGKEADKQRMYAAARFAAVFGNFTMNEDGKVEMTRNTAKNPMTKVNYGSGVKGVGEGVADDMIKEFYSKIASLPEGADRAEFFGYPHFEQDIEILFGGQLPADLEDGRFTFQPHIVEEFRKNISQTLGQVLSDAAKEVLGDKIAQLNDVLVFTSNVQTEYMSLVFQTKLEELVEQRAKEGKVRRNKKGKAIVTNLSKRDYDSVVKEVSVLAPVFASDEQTLAIAGFDNQQSPYTLSSNMNEKLRQKSSLPAPGEAGVKAIPFSVIGTGDAMMMNLVYGSQGAMGDTLPIFDGIDVPVNKVKEYAQHVNQQVLASWDRDVLGSAVTNFQSFLNHVGNDPLVAQAFTNVQGKSKNSSVTAQDAKALMADLEERHRQNKARKAVFKRIGLTVDQMGGSSEGFTREGGKLTRSEINRLIHQELNQVEETKTEEQPSELVISTGEATLSALLKDASGPLKQSIKAIQDKLPTGLQIIIGDVDQINEYRQENFPDDGQFLEGKGNYDVANNVIFSTSKDPETLVHELIHAATFQTVLAHYSGKKNDAVSRIEKLMDEFMELAVDNAGANSARAAILQHQTQETTFAKAAALNEFMAWGLTNKDLIKTLKETKTRTLVGIVKSVVALMRRVMGGVPQNIFDNLVFNTKVLNEVPSDNGNNNGGDNSDGEITPPASNNTNHWVQMVRDLLAVSHETDAFVQREKLPAYSNAAFKTMDDLNRNGFPMTTEQQQIFLATHMMMATEMKLDSASLLVLQKTHEYVVENLTPESFGKGRQAQEKFSVVMDLMGKTKNKEGISDAVAVLLALSQTSKTFRNALDQLETMPEQAHTQDLNGRLTQAVSFLMRKVTGSIDTAGKSSKEVLDALDYSIVRMDLQKEFTGLQTIGRGLDIADTTMKDAFSSLAGFVSDQNQQLQESEHHKLTKGLGNTVSLAANLLDSDRAAITAEGAKALTHSGIPLEGILTPVRELVSEVVGTDASNKNLVALLDKTNHAVSAARQAFREDLPVILQNGFTTHPDASQWKSMFNTLAKTDIQALTSLGSLNKVFRFVSEKGIRNKEIARLEQDIRDEYLPYVAQDVLDKAEQLAAYMNGQGAGHNLLRNAYAIDQMVDGDPKPHMIGTIDQLVSLYALRDMDPDMREQTVEMYQNEPKAVANLVAYMQHLNAQEDAKDISEKARLNGYKGYVPNHGKKDVRIEIKPTDYANQLKAEGYTELAPATAEDASIFSKSYFVNTAKTQGNYSQGIIQQAQLTYRGVDVDTGLTVNGTTSGIITGEAKDQILKDVEADEVKAKETLTPIFDENGEVEAFERAINPDILDRIMEPDENLALMLGSWAGRQVEETAAKEYNKAVVDELKSIYDNREPGTDNQFINIADPDLKDEIYKETYRVIPIQTKNYIASQFGEQFWVRKDHINLALGYREASVVDMWSGKTRLPKSVQNTVTGVTTMFFGDKALKVVGSFETGAQQLISSAKDIIVVRSMVVPMMNLKANVIQLTTRGVPTKQVYKGFREKLAEVEKYNQNVKEKIELEARVRLAGVGSNRAKVLEQRIQSLDDLNARMSIAPLIEAGAYKNLSEGLTDLDVELTSGNLGDWVEQTAERILPAKVNTVVQYGLVGKSTALYKGLNRAVQYGDFLAKAIYYDHLIAKGFDHDTAIAKMNEEFVNFSVLPGRTRSYLEGVGGTWFFAFKLRIAKIAMQHLRENPVRAFVTGGLTEDSPIQDNIFSVIADDKLGYSMGYEMLFGAPELNPWVNAADWANK